MKKASKKFKNKDFSKENGKENKFNFKKAKKAKKVLRSKTVKQEIEKTLTNKQIGPRNLVQGKISSGLSGLKTQIKKAKTSSKKLSSKIKSNIAKNIKVDQFLTKIPNKILKQIDDLKKELPNQKESVQTLQAIGLRILDEAKKVSDTIKPKGKLSKIKGLKK